MYMHKLNYGHVIYDIANCLLHVTFCLDVILTRIGNVDYIWKKSIEGDFF